MSKTAYLSILLSSFSVLYSEILDKPIANIKGKASSLNHPEGIAFSPSRDFVVVTNAYSNSLSFFKQKDGYIEDSPYYIMDGTTSQLKFPHDVDFSPNGQHLAVANRNDHSITIYGKTPNRATFNRTPMAKIKGKSSKLEYPDSLAYSKKDNILAVANSGGDTITLYRYARNAYENSPYQTIKGVNHLLHTPDGVSFSSDGKLLAVTNHSTHAIYIYERSDTTQLFSEDPVEILQGAQTNFEFPHSITFHPKTDDLAVSNSGGEKTLNIFKRISDKVPRYSTAPSQTISIYAPNTDCAVVNKHSEGGIKGLKYSSDGAFIGVCASDFVDHTQAVLIYSVE